MEHTLTNGKRVDCFLFLGEPHECVPIDSKFAWENYTKFVNADDSLSVSQGDFASPETLLKSPIDCDFSQLEGEEDNNSDQNWEEEEDKW